MIVAAFILLADAAIVAVPALAENPGATSSAASSSTASPSAGAYPSAGASQSGLDIAIATPDGSRPDWSRDSAAEWPTLLPATPTPTAKPTPRPTPRDTVWNARIWLKVQVGARQYSCIYQLWYKESKWNPFASNRSGAYGIPQAYPGSKMAAFGSNWRYSPLTQVKWGLSYVNSRYGSGCDAWAFWQSHGWY